MPGARVLSALEMAGLSTNEAEAWRIWLWHWEHFGSWPLLTLGHVCITFVCIYTRLRRWEEETHVCAETETVLCVKLGKYLEMGWIITFTHFNKLN